MRVCEDRLVRKHLPGGQLHDLGRFVCTYDADGCKSVDGSPYEEFVVVGMLRARHFFHHCGFAPGVVQQSMFLQVTIETTITTVATAAAIAARAVVV